MNDGDCVTNLVVPAGKEKLLKPEEHLFEVCRSKDLFEAKKVLFDEYPEIALARNKCLMKNLSEFFEHNIKKESMELRKENTFEISDFDKLSNENMIEITN